MPRDLDELKAAVTRVKETLDYITDMPVTLNEEDSERWRRIFSKIHQRYEDVLLVFQEVRYIPSELGNPIHPANDSKNIIWRIVNDEKRVDCPWIRLQATAYLMYQSCGLSFSSFRDLEILSWRRIEFETIQLPRIKKYLDRLERNLSKLD